MHHQRLYPIHLLPSRMASFIHEIMTHRDVPADLVAPAVLSATAAAIQGVSDVMLPFGDIVPMSLYALIVGESGLRASSVMRAIRPTFDRFESGDLGKPHHQFLVQSATESGIVDVLRDGAKSIFMASDEGSTVLPKLKMASMCSRFDGDTERHNTRATGAFAISGHRTSMCIMIQRSEFNRFMRKKGDEFMSSGFSGRLLTSAPRANAGYRITNSDLHNSTRLSDHQFSKQIEETLLNYQRLLDKGLKREVQQFSSESSRIWWNFNQSIEIELRQGGFWNDVNPIARKTGQLAGRIAAVLQFFENQQSNIEPWAVHAGCGIAAWHLGEAKLLFGDTSLEMELENDASALLDKITQLRARGHQAVTKSLLMRLGPSHLRKRDALEAPLALLQARGFILTNSTRRSELIHLRPISPPATFQSALPYY